MLHKRYWIKAKNTEPKIINCNKINANFGDRNIAERIGKIDAILLFYVLLHQVKPDWDEILEM